MSWSFASISEYSAAVLTESSFGADVVIFRA
jgi:hypothetical protein